MTTATPSKTKIATSWDTAKIQDETAAAFARNMGVTMTFLQKLGPDAMTEYRQSMVSMKFEHYKSLGVKTPLELVKAMAEFEANVFGSKINVWGDDKQAWLEYEVCGCFNAMQKTFKMNEQQQQEMGQCFSASTEALAKHFGFHSELKFGCKPGEACCTISFSR